MGILTKFGVMSSDEPQSTRAGSVHSTSETASRASASASDPEDFDTSSAFGHSHNGTDSFVSSLHPGTSHTSSIVQTSSDDDDDDDDNISGLSDDDDFSDGGGGNDSGVSDMANLTYAPRQSQREFRKTFSPSDVPASEQVYKAYVCALSKEILHHGKMFVTDHYVCFYSRLFNVTQKLVIPFSDIVKIEPKMTMTFIPNAIGIRTKDDSRYTFASFSNRNRSMAVLRNLRNSTSSFSPNGGDNTDARSSVLHAGASARGISDQDEGDDNGDRSGHGVGNGHKNPASTRIRSSTLSDGGSVAASSFNRSRAQSPLDEAASVKSNSGNNTSTSMAQGGSKSGAGKKWPVENLGPEEHPKTSPPGEEENEKSVTTEIIKAPMGVVANILFGKDTSWYKHFLVDVEKNRDLGDLPAFPELKQGAKRAFSYIKPLNGPVGPKQTKCNATEKVEHWDLENYIEVIATTATPDVPSGNSFTTLTRTVLSWNSNNTTQVRLGTWLEWTGKSWLKGPIEKGAYDGQVSYGKALVAELANKVGSGSSGARSGASAKPAATDGMKPAEVVTSSSSKEKQSSSAKQANQAIKEWQQLCIGLGVACLLLFLIILWMWVRSGRRTARTAEETKTLLRIQEELDLWEWIDNRRASRIPRRQAFSDANIEAAIAATEKKLASLKAELID